MLAIGRAPNTEMLHVEKAGVELGRRGEVVVDRFSRTSAEHIYAIGDVTDRVQLSPSRSTRRCVLKNGVRRQTDFAGPKREIATAVFTSPEIGVVGMSEMKALGLGHSIDVYKSTFKPLRHTMTGRDERMMMKLYRSIKSPARCSDATSSATQQLKIIQIVGVALKMGATKEQFDSTIALSSLRSRGARDHAHQELQQGALARLSG